MAYDFIGRRFTYFVLMMLSGIAVLFSPYVKEIYPWLLVIKIVFIVGLAPVMVPPALNDYIDSNTRGRAVILTAIASEIVDALTTGVYYRFTHGLDPHIIFSVLSGICIGSAILMVGIA